MAGSTAPTGVAGSGYFSHCRQSVLLNLTLDRPLRNKEAGANESFVAGPIVTRGVAVFSDRGEQGIASKSRAVFVVRNYAGQRFRLLRHRGSVRGRRACNAFRQQRRRRHQNMTARGPESRLRHAMHLVDLYRDSQVRPANQRSRTSCETWFIRVADVTRI